MSNRAALVLALLALSSPLPAQTTNPAADPSPLTLSQALARARQYAPQIESANAAAAIAREDRKQAKVAALPTVNALNQFIYTQGNGTPSGVYVAADGVHVYNEQAIVHEELLSIVRRGEIRRAIAAEATARARIDLASRGLTATVVTDYYAVVTALRRARNAQTSLDEAGRFLDITQKQEKGGEVAHSDVIKAQLQQQQRQRDLQDATLNIEKAKIALAVLIFPALLTDYAIADDADTTPTVTLLTEATALATASSPDLRVAQSALREATLSVGIARYAYLPSFSADFFYGINANQFAAHSSGLANESGRSTLPDYPVERRKNLGYSAQITLNIPVWNWGVIRSKVKQAELRQLQAEHDIKLSQRQLQGTVALAHRESEGALAQLESLRSSSLLAAESLRLTVLRYQAGEATALEVVDAQTSAALARTALDDGLVRYRLALATLQTLTGTL